jgi:glycosyltransferase involved in cell wall biosynthesis
MNVLSLVTNRYACFYVEQSMELNKNGVTLTHISPRQQTPDHGEQQDICRSVFDYATMYPNILRESLKKYDIVHANNGKTAPFALAQHNRPIVLSLWGSDLAGKYGRMTKLCAKLCDEVIVMSKEMNNKLDADAHVIPHGINMNKFAPMPKISAQEEIGWDSSSKHVLFPYYPGRKLKNFPLAEQVVEQVQSRVSEPIELHAVYNIDHDRMPIYMNASDALLLTSKREGFPNSVKEAMACNLPVVSTDVGGVRNRLSKVSNSYVGTSDAELVESLTNVIKSEQRSDGRIHASDLSLEQMANDILDVYKKAVQ